MFASEDMSNQLEQYLSSYSIDSNPRQRELLLMHLDLVVEKNKVMNLTRIVDAQQALVRHVVDSLLVVPTIQHLGLGENTRFLDIGTGGGFPGIPLGIVMGYRGTLIDSVGKKIRAVSEFITCLGLEGTLRAENIRAEELARREPRQYDLVVARAVAESGVLIEYASPLLSEGGYLVLSKAHLSDLEIERAQKTARLTGMKAVSRETYELPNDEGHREILTYFRQGKSKTKLPRNTGMALHHPLAG